MGQGLKERSEWKQAVSGRVAALTTSPCSADLYTPDTISLCRSKNNASSAISCLFLQSRGFGYRLGPAWGFWIAPQLLEQATRLAQSAAGPSLLGDRGIHSTSWRLVMERVWSRDELTPGAPGPAAERESLTATGTKPSPWRPDPAPRRGGENTTSGPLYPGIPPALWSQSAFPGVSCRRREDFRVPSGEVGKRREELPLPSLLICYVRHNNV